MSNITGALMPHAPFDLKKGAAEALFNTIAHGQSPRTTNVLNTPGIVESFIRMVQTPGTHMLPPPPFFYPNNILINILMNCDELYFFVFLFFVVATLFHKTYR
jgi:hypothetical protein